MSDELVIRVEKLGTCCRIRRQPPQRYIALRDVLTQKLFAPWRRLGSLVRHRPRPTAPGPLSLIPKSEIIYLNGAILGMTPAKIRKRVDEIIAGAESRTICEHAGQILALVIAPHALNIK